jgi:hypothetical protein
VQAEQGVGARKQQSHMNAWLFLFSSQTNERRGFYMYASQQFNEL